MKFKLVCPQLCRDACTVLQISGSKSKTFYHVQCSQADVGNWQDLIIWGLGKPCVTPPYIITYRKARWQHGDSTHLLRNSRNQRISEGISAVRSVDNEDGSAISGLQVHMCPCARNRQAPGLRRQDFGAKSFNGEMRCVTVHGQCWVAACPREKVEQEMWKNATQATTHTQGPPHCQFSHLQIN